MRFAGIDYSTFHIDVVLIGGDRPIRWVHYDLPKKKGRDAFDRTRAVRDVLPPRTNSIWDDVAGVAIEEPIHNRPQRRHSAHKLKGVQGAILSCLPRLDDLRVEAVRAVDWRVALGMKGNCSKEDVREWVEGELDAEVLYDDGDDWTQDAVDAYCLARVAELREPLGEPEDPSKATILG